MRRWLVVLAVAVAAGVGATRDVRAEHAWIPIALAVKDELVAKDWPRVTARFDATMKDALPADKLAAVWASVIAQAGPFLRVEKTALTEARGYHVVALTCAFERAALTVKVSLDRAGAVSGIFFLPAVAPETWAAPAYGRAPVDERALTVGPASLHGELVLPRGAGPWPAVVLVHGSGPHDEDETTGASRPFHDLALGLAARGVASLRYVKRTAADPGRFTPGRRFTLREETIDDARTAVALLSATPPVDPARVWVVGHSLGGYAAPRIAGGDPQVAGLVILAGPTRPLEELLIEQVRYLSRGDPDRGAARLAEAEAAARAVRSSTLAEGTVVDFMGAKLPGSYFLDMRRYHPAALSASLPIPILVLQGGRDYQVSRADYQGWTKALAGRANATLELYPELNHLFEVGTGPPGPEEYHRPGQHVAEEVIADIARFIEKHPR